MLDARANENGTRDFLVKWPDGAEDSWVRPQRKPSATPENEIQMNGRFCRAQRATSSSSGPTARRTPGCARDTNPLQALKKLSQQKK